MIKKILLFLLFLPTIVFAASAKVLNVYIWTEYLPDEVLRQFEKETGIRVNLSEFDSNETLYVKLKAAPFAGYDIIVPSSYFVDKMRKQGMLHKLDKTKLPNFKYLKKSLLNRNFDPENEYSVPYTMGTTGIVINKKYFDPKAKYSWSDLWQKKFRNQLLLLDDLREVFSIAFITLGYSINEVDADKIKEAYEKLVKLMPNIKLFSSDAIKNIYVDEDVNIGSCWSGDYEMAKEENPNLVYVYPEDGYPIWIDCLAIAKNSKHLEEAHKFINFILRPDIAEKIALINHFSTPNEEASKLLPKALRDDIVFNPNDEILKKRPNYKKILEIKSIFIISIGKN